MYTQFRTGQNGALMDEYEIAIQEFLSVMQNIPLEVYQKKFSNEKNLNSIQSIVLHVINSGYVYANYYRKRFNEKVMDNIQIKSSSPQEASESLIKMFQYSLDTLNDKWQMNDDEMMNTLIKTGWSIYDLESLWEHAIVHVYRHRRQIHRILKENFGIKNF